MKSKKRNGKRVPKTQEQRKTVKAITTQAHDSDLLNIVDRFLKGKNIEVESFDNKQYFVLKGISGDMKLIEYDKKLTTQDLLGVLKVTICANIISKGAEDSGYLDRLEVYGTNKDFKFFHSKKYFNSLYNTFTHFKYIIIKNEQDKKPEILAEKVSELVIQIIEKVVQNDKSGINTRKLQDIILREFSPEDFKIDINFKKIKVPNVGELEIEELKLIKIIQILIKRGAIYPHNGMTNEDILNLVRPVTSEKSVLKYLKTTPLERYKERNKKMLEIANHIICKDLQKKFYLVQGLDFIS